MHLKNHLAHFLMGFLLFLCLLIYALPVKAQKGNVPVILIPGLIGSELVNQKTGEKVWFKISRSKNDDLRLPISPNLSANRDNLVPRGIFRSAPVGLLKRQDIYGGFIEKLKAEGYREATLENPPTRGFEKTLYIFAYDWRRDNVENARLLIRKIENLKRKLKRPNLKFNVVAHSMGGLIARYAAMYGDRDLPPNQARLLPNWAGARHFEKIFLVGTPNEGSILALKSLTGEFSLGGITINLPFVQNLTVFDLFTIPSIYQLLPMKGALRVFDENLSPLKVDIFDVKTWDFYGWSIPDKKGFDKKFKGNDLRNARSYFSVVLNRARRFHEALNANTADVSLKIYPLGSDCKETLDAMIIYRDGNNWRTLFEVKDFRRQDGTKASVEELKKLLFVPGDSVVSRSSLLGASLLNNGLKPFFSDGFEYFQCEGHNSLIANPAIQAELLNLLNLN
jgi:pimeloyl-ACP methyl ester carboxylesterase